MTHRIERIREYQRQRDEENRLEALDLPGLYNEIQKHYSQIYELIATAEAWTEAGINKEDTKVLFGATADRIGIVYNEEDKVAGIGTTKLTVTLFGGMGNTDTEEEARAELLRFIHGLDDFEKSFYAFIDGVVGADEEDDCDDEDDCYDADLESEKDGERKRLSDFSPRLIQNDWIQ